MFGSLEDTFEEAKTSWYSGAFHVTALGARPFVSVNVVAILKGYSGCFTRTPQLPYGQFSKSGCPFWVPNIVITAPL